MRRVRHVQSLLHPVSPQHHLSASKTPQPLPTQPSQIRKMASDPNGVPDATLFEVRTIEGKGRAVFAHRLIRRSERIMAETPLFIVQSEASIETVEATIASKLRSLPREQQRQFLSLHNSFPGKLPFSGIVRTNAFPCGVGASTGAVYPTICLINHSCLPNTHHSWNDSTKQETVHAVRDIAAGEEITNCYSLGGVYSSRRASLRESFGFDCTCSVCLLSEGLRIASDALRLEIERLDDVIGDPARVMQVPEDCLEDCRKLLDLLDAEYEGCAAILAARVYYDAFQICISHGDQARAKTFAKRAYELRVVCEGEDSPETGERKHLMENPAGHRNFGASQKWRTKKSRVPNGLDTKDFENWLWRSGR